MSDYLKTDIPREGAGAAPLDFQHNWSALHLRGGADGLARLQTLAAGDRLWILDISTEAGDGQSGRLHYVELGDLATFIGGGGGGGGASSFIELTDTPAGFGGHANKPLIVNAVAGAVDFGDTGLFVPTGGSAGQVLTKVDGTDLNTIWANVLAEAVTVAGSATTLAPATADVEAWLAAIDDFLGSLEGGDVPAGGAAGSVLAKVDGTDFNSAWSGFLKAFDNRLELVATANNEPRVELRSAGTPATDILRLSAWTDGTGGALRFFRAAGSAVLDLDPLPLDGTSDATVQLFRETNTSGAIRLRFYRGDNTSGHVADLIVDREVNRLEFDGVLRFGGTFDKPVIVRNVRLWADDDGRLRTRNVDDPLAHDDGFLIGSGGAGGGGHIFDLEGTPESIGDLDGRLAVWSASVNGLDGGPTPGPLVEISEVEFAHLAPDVVDAIHAGGAIPAAVTADIPTHTLPYGAGGGDDQRAHRNVLIIAADATALVVPKAAPVGSTWFVDLATGNTVTVAVEDDAGSVNGIAQGSVTAEHEGGTIVIWVRANAGSTPVVRVSGDTTEVTKLGSDTDANGHVIFGNRHRIYRGLSGVQTLSAANFSAGSELIHTGAAATYTVPARVTVADEAESLVVDNIAGSGTVTLSASGVTFEGSGGTTVPQGETRALTWSSDGTTHFCRVR